MMSQVLNHIISALLQIVVFALLPFVVYLIKTKSGKGFFDYIGLKRSTKKAYYLSVFGSLFFVFGGVGMAVLNSDIRELLTTPPTVTGQLKQMGLNPGSILILLIVALFKTSLSEEIFFRGFVAKRLMDKFGYQSGNILQALFFAIIHVVLFWALTKSGIIFLSFIFLLSGTAGYLTGYLKEKVGNGSILPGWLAHGLGNTLSYFIIAFVI
jgi:uncharacterized protein